MRAPTRLLHIADFPTTTMPVVTLAPVTPLPVPPVPLITSYVLPYSDEVPYEHYALMVDGLVRGAIAQHYFTLGFLPTTCHLGWQAVTHLMALRHVPFPYRHIHDVILGRDVEIAIV